MQRDLVIGIDSSTTATKAIAWDRTGAPAADGRAKQKRARIGFARFGRLATRAAFSGSMRDRRSRAYALISSDSPRCPKI